MNRRVFHGPSASGPWEQHPDQSGLPVIVAGLPNGVQRFFKGANVDPATGLVSPESEIISATPVAGTNPSPLVSWIEPTPANVGLTDPGALVAAPAYNFDTATLIEDYDFPGGLRITGQPRLVTIRSNRIRIEDGLGGANLNTMIYGLSVDPSFAGGSIRVIGNDFSGASSASILADFADFTISRNNFIDSGADHIKCGAASMGTNYVTQNVFQRMANSWMSRGYNDPSNASAYHNVNYIHGDPLQLEDLQPGVSWQVVGNAFNLVGTYASVGAPQPTVTGFPIGPYSAAVFCVARNYDIVGDQYYVPFLVEGNWIKGTTIPVRFDGKNGHLNTGWGCNRNIFRPEIEVNLLDYVGAGTVEGNVWEPTGANCDAHMLAGSGPNPGA